ncbi:MAG: hypothetical protein HKP09_04995 [Enterobacterales bacterium]|nr:hypothetical protein [Enterobacterales bacterium]
MTNLALIEPIMALVALTFVVLVIVPFVRIGAILKGKAHIKDYRYGDTDNVPVRARLLNRNLMNLLQMPVLFYLVCLLFIITETTSTIALNLAWAFVILRIIHSLVHIGYNNITHRFVAFLLSNIVLFGMWLELFSGLYL